ncbi:MAG: hypothetical protein CMJ78_01740 [Planctomycetaceae bacterium]|nr:hypothetical protein [Planctomycetaceae bacterium]
MKSRLAHLTAIVVLSIISVPNSSDAGVIPWLYDAVFGPAYGYGPGCQTCYSPVPAVPYAAGCGPCRPMIRPVWSWFPRCAPLAFNPCFTCGPAGCPTGKCGIATSKPATPKPEANNEEVPSTFADGEEASPTDGFVPVDDGSESKGGTIESFLPPKTQNSEGAPISDPIEEKVDPLEADGFQLRPPPEGESTEGNDGSKQPDGLPQDEGTEGEQPGSLPQEEGRLDRAEGNIAWRVVPKRARLVRRSSRTVAIPKTVRHNNDWTPVADPTLVVGK